jgi:hypothetical protein
MGSHFIRMSRFGRKGRFGNQLFQYAYLRIMANRWAADLELPDWIGQEFFGLPRHPISKRVAKCNLVEPGGDEYLQNGYRLGFDADLRDADVEGWFQYHTSMYRPYANQWRAWFQPTSENLHRIEPACERLRASGDTLVGIHIRRGDYGRGYFYLTPVSWYQRWLEDHWNSLCRPILFVSSEEPRLIGQFARWNAHSAESLGVLFRSHPLRVYNYKCQELQAAERQQFDFYPSFYLLSRCDILLIPNSTFSFTAAMTGSLRECWRSSLRAGGFIRFDPWNDDPLERERAEQFGHLDGILAHRDRSGRRRA